MTKRVEIIGEKRKKIDRVCGIFFLKPTRLDYAYRCLASFSTCLYAISHATENYRLHIKMY